jgi:DNA-binding response OmpR family regulator
LAEVIKDRLEQEGMEADIAKDGKEGLAKISEGKPDIIVLDILMPVMDGLTMLKEMRAKEGEEKTPVVVLTNLGTDEDAKAAFERGADVFLIKANLKLEDVVARVKEEVEKTRE